MTDHIVDWKPVNPCKGCDARKQGCGVFCRVLSEYCHELSAQKRLLEYLIAHPEMFGYPDIFGRMLKELEELK
jgi:hypothetical protein